MGHIAGNYGLRAVTEPGQKHFHLFRGGVLRFIKNDESMIERAAAHIGQRRDFNHLALKHAGGFFNTEQVIKRVVERAQVRVDLLREVAGQKAEPLARFDGGPGQDQPLDGFPLQSIDRTGHRQIGFAGTGRAQAEGDVVLENLAQILALARRAALQVLAPRLQHRRLVVGIAARSPLFEIDDGQLQIVRRQRGAGAIVKGAQRRCGQIGLIGFAFDLKAARAAFDADLEGIGNLPDIGVERATEIGQTLVVQWLRGELKS